MLIVTILVVVILLRVFVCKEKSHVYSAVDHNRAKLSGSDPGISLQDVTVTSTSTTCERVSTPDLST